MLSRNIEITILVEYEEDFDDNDAGHRSGDGIGTDKKAAV
jgi:hypothetical protein